MTMWLKVAKTTPAIHPPFAPAQPGSVQMKIKIWFKRKSSWKPTVKTSSVLADLWSVRYKSSSRPSLLTTATWAMAAKKVGLLVKKAKTSLAVMAPSFLWSLTAKWLAMNPPTWSPSTTEWWSVSSTTRFASILKRRMQIKCQKKIQSSKKQTRLSKSTPNPWWVVLLKLKRLQLFRKSLNK